MVGERPSTERGPLGCPSREPLPLDALLSLLWSVSSFGLFFLTPPHGLCTDRGSLSLRKAARRPWLVLVGAAPHTSVRTGSGAERGKVGPPA